MLTLLVAMALTHFFFANSILLLSLSGIASAAANAYNSKPDVVKSETSYVPNSKPKTVYDIPNPDHYIPKPEHLPAPKIDRGKPGYEPESLLPIGIEGLVVCKSGSNYIPIQGALVRIACMAVDQNGYETSHISCLTDATNAKGYYYKTLFPLGDLGHNLKLKECKAYLESSPLETCKIPTDVNNGVSGALLSSYHILSHNNVKLYSMRTFFYTSETTSTSTPAGGY